MKQMACKELGGECDKLIAGSSPDEMHEHWKQHAALLAKHGDDDHKEAIRMMRDMSGGDFAMYWVDLKKNFENADDADEGR
jgi:hypothetical protein